MYILLANFFFGERFGRVEQVGIIEEVEVQFKVEVLVIIRKVELCISVVQLVVVLWGIGCFDKVVVDEEVVVGFKVVGKCFFIIILVKVNDCFEDEQCVSGECFLKNL